MRRTEYRTVTMLTSQIQEVAGTRHEHVRPRRRQECTSASGCMIDLNVEGIYLPSEIDSPWEYPGGRLSLPRGGSLSSPARVPFTPRVLLASTPPCRLVAQSDELLCLVKTTPSLSHSPLILRVAPHHSTSELSARQRKPPSTRGESLPLPPPASI
jgi:hypothetical protein